MRVGRGPTVPQCACGGAAHKNLQCRNRATRSAADQETPMPKGEQRSNREKKKPKKEKVPAPKMPGRPGFPAPGKK